MTAPAMLARANFLDPSVLAACLAYFSSMQRDRVGLATINERIAEYVPPSAKHLQLLLHALDRIEHRPPEATPAGTQARLRPPLKKLPESVRRRSMLVLIS